MTNHCEGGGVSPVNVTEEQGHEIERRVREALKGESFAVSKQRLDLWAVGVVPHSSDSETTPPPLSDEAIKKIQTIFDDVKSQ